MRIKRVSLASAALLLTGIPLTAQRDSNVGSWKTWVLTTGAELRVQPPPSREQTAAMTQMRFWTAGPPAYRWVAQMLDLIETRGFSNPKNARNFALLNVAMYDATVAAWDSKYAYSRPRPSAA